MAQIRQVVSEALQSRIRSLLPSQRGFTEDLQASNVITPIIDLTPTAEGDVLPVDLSRALAFGSQTAHDVNNATTVLANTTGFYRIFGVLTVLAGDGQGSFSLSDGLSTKTIWGYGYFAGNLNEAMSQPVDYIVFLASGESISCTCNANAEFKGTSRQIADINGTIVNPSGFSSS